MNNLKLLRKAQNKSQNEVASALSMKRTTYARYENKTAAPNIDTITKMADYFHVTVDTLLGHEVPYLLDKSTLSKSQTELIELVPQLNDRLCEKVSAYILGLLEAELERQAIIERLKK